MLAAAFAFGNSLRAPFHFDDHALFVDPAIVSPGGFWDVWRPDQSRPLTWFTFWANYRLHGRWAPGFHFVNLAVHLVASCLVLACLSRIIPLRCAQIAAAIFAIHPIQTEAVVYVFARGTLLAAALCLISYYCWLRGWHWKAAATFALALLAKEECAAFPVFLALQHLSISRNRAELPPILLMLGLSLAAVARVAILTTVTPGSGAGVQAGITPLDYFVTQGWVILRYLLLLAVPVGFTVDPDIAVLSGWRGLLCWLTIAALAAAALRAFHGARSGFWFLAGLILLAPTSTIFPASDLSADRRVYLPLFALAAAAGMLLERTGVPRLLTTGGVVLAMLSFARTHVWRSESALWEDAMRWAPEKVRPRVQLARVAPRGQAHQFLMEARRLAPNDPLVASELGRLYLAENKPGEALKEFGLAVAANPNDPFALNNRGVALRLLGMAELAKADFRKALDLRPCLFDARLNLAKTGERTELPADCRVTPEQRMEWQDWREKYKPGR